MGLLCSIISWSLSLYSSSSFLKCQTEPIMRTTSISISISISTSISPCLSLTSSPPPAPSPNPRRCRRRCHHGHDRDEWDQGLERTYEITNKVLLRRCYTVQLDLLEPCGQLRRSLVTTIAFSRCFRIATIASIFAASICG